MSIDNDDDLNINQEINVGLSATSNFVKKIFTLKNPDNMLKQAKDSGLSKTLTAFDLIILGVGCIIGSGIFTIVGIAAAGSATTTGAGTGLIASVIIASIACIFSALCYSEFASMIPVAGSAYVYTYATMGELMAWMIGWVLMLEYAIGTIAVASSWTGYFIQFLQGFPFLPEIIQHPPVWLTNNYNSVVALNQQASVPVIAGVPVRFVLASKVTIILSDPASVAD